MHRASDDVPTVDSVGDPLSDTVQTVLRTLMDKTDCYRLSAHDSTHGLIGYWSKRGYVEGHVFNIVADAGGEVMFAGADDGYGHAEFVFADD